MSFEYFFEFPGGSTSDSFFSTFMMIYFIVYMAVYIGAYIALHFIEAKGLYTIAKRRGIPHAAYAYIPILKFYTAGKIAEQYEAAQCGKTRAHARRLLIFGSIAYISMLLMLIFMVIALAGTGTLISSNAEEFSGMAVGFGGMAVFMWIALAFSIPYSIFSAFAYYKLFLSIGSKTNAIVFTALSIAVGVTTPFYILKKRDSDEGFIELQKRYDEEQAQP